MGNRDRIALSKEKKTKMISKIKKYYHDEKEEEISDLAADLLLMFILDELAPEFYNLGIEDSYKFMTDKLDDILTIQKVIK
jgi:uncharacterized protein (DUF2164 family)